MKILICDSLEKDVIDIFSKIGEVTNISDDENKEDQISKNILDAEVVVIRSATTITKELINSAKQLKVIARCGVGVDNIDLDYCKKLNIRVFIAEHANKITVAEHIFFMLLILSLIHI